MLWDLGPFRGRLPQYIILTDRIAPCTGVDPVEGCQHAGKLWVLQHVLPTPCPPPVVGQPPCVVGPITISLSAVIPTTPDKLIYAPFDGPILDTNPRIRLLASGGVLGYEVEQLPFPTTDRKQAPILTRRGTAKEAMQITLPQGWKPGDPLAWSAVSFAQPSPDPYAH
jgi:hypothetical protein